MKLAALALDYDGTIARDDVLDPGVREEIHAARAAGVAVVLVTGRTLDDLHRVAGDLGLFDAVVAENGAVVVFPPSGRTLMLSRPAPPRFIEALRTSGIDVRVGACVVDMDAAHGCAVLKLLRDLELPLVTVFNRSRLMILPQGLSKATGLHEALRTLGLSEHNTVAIGDAENDHTLLEVCELGAAVAWGSSALREVADDVVAGDGPPSVAAYIRRLIGQAHLPSERIGRRELLLGRTERGAEVRLAVRGRNVLVAGDSRSGKSYLAGLLAEQLILQHYCVFVIDPEGDYRSLGALGGVVVYGGEVPPPPPTEVLHALRYPEVSVVLDLSRLEHDSKREYVSALMPRLAELRRRRGVPHRLVLDEAHYFLSMPAVRSLLDLDDGGYTLATYRVAEINREFLETMPVVLATRLTDPAGIQALRALAGDDGSGDWTALHDLPLADAILLPTAPEAGGRLLRFRTAPRVTDHVRHREKYTAAAVSQRHSFVFTADGVSTGARARTLPELADGIAIASAHSLDGHVRRGDFSRWVKAVIGDEVLASRLHELQANYDATRPAQAREAIVGTIRARYAGDADCY